MTDTILIYWELGIGCSFILVWVSRKLAWFTVIFVWLLDFGSYYWYISAFWNNPNAAPSTRERPKLWKLRAMLNAVTTVSSGSCPTVSTPFWFLTMWLEAGCGTGACMTYICATKSRHATQLSLADRPANPTAVVERSDTIDPSKSINCSLSKRVKINEWSNWDISCRGIIVPNR